MPTSEPLLSVIAIQTIVPAGLLDCFAEFIIGRRFAPTDGSQ
jgi:hypothetical protein